MLLEHARDHRLLQMRVPDVERRVLLEAREAGCEDLIEELAQVLDVDLAIDVRPILAGVLRAVGAGG